MSKRKKQHAVPAAVAAQVQELFAKHQKDIIIFVVEYIKDKRRYYEAKYLWNTQSDFLQIRLNKQHTNATLEALKEILKRTNCSNCKVVVVSAISSGLNLPDSIPQHDVMLWREIRNYIDTQHIQVKDIVARDAAQVHSIIRDQNLFKVEIKLRRQKEQKISKSLQSQTAGHISANVEENVSLAEVKSVVPKNNEPVAKEKTSDSKKTNDRHKHKKNSYEHSLYYSHADVFSISKFTKSHFDEYCLFVSGSKHVNNGEKYEQGTYQYIVNYKDSFIHVKKNTVALRSANDVMLSGIINALNENIAENAKVNVVIYTKLGFEHPEKSANRELVKEILQIAKEKKVKLNIHLIHKGTDKIRQYVERRK